LLHQFAAFTIGHLGLFVGCCLLLVLMLLNFLGSCSTVRFGYSNADTLAYWWLDGYVDFHSAQKLRSSEISRNY